MGVTNPHPIYSRGEGSIPTPGMPSPYEKFKNIGPDHTNDVY